MILPKETAADGAEAPRNFAARSASGEGFGEGRGEGFPLPTEERWRESPKRFTPPPVGKAPRFALNPEAVASWRPLDKAGCFCHRTGRLARRRAAKTLSLQFPCGVRIPIRNLAGSLALGLLLGISASAEELRYPVDVAVGPGGEIYVADIEAAALLRWSGAGFEVVAQGEGLPRTPLFGIRHIVPEGDGAILASDPATMALYRITVAGEITAIPDDAGFVTPWGIAVDPSGGILAVDRVTQRLRRVGSDSIEDLATIRAPRAILAGSDGSLHVLTDRNVLRMEDGDAHPLVQSPPFEFPHDFVRAPDGGFFVTDGYARCIWKVSPDGRVSVHAKGEPLVSPQGIALDKNGDLLVADAHARTIFRISGGGQVLPLGE